MSSVDESERIAGVHTGVQSNAIAQLANLDPAAARAALQNDRRRRRQARKVLSERNRLNRRMTGFVSHESEAWMRLRQRFGSDVTHDELVSVAELVASRIGLQVDRDAKRRKAVLIKWFTENWRVVSQWIDFVILVDDEEEDVLNTNYISIDPKRAVFRGTAHGIQ